MATTFLSKKTAKIVFGISVFTLILSIGLLFVFQKIYDAKLKEDITLENGTLVTKIWQDIPLPIYEKLFFFNISNGDSFLRGEEPLNVTEVGPYTYKSKWVKPNPEWHSNRTVSYREIRTYEFVPEMSVGTEDDLVYTLNAPMIIGANILKNKIERAAFNAFCKFVAGENVVMLRSIRQLAYEGYKDIIIESSWLVKSDLPYKDGRFSWLYGKNATNDGLFTVFTGSDDEKKTGLIDKWNGNEKLSFWKDDSCNMLNGTSIEHGPPIKDFQENYAFFQTFFCRLLTFNYTEDITHYDIPSKRFKPTYSLFANSTENPDNYCFEVQKERPSGVLDISPCEFGAPVLVSFPHFHMADPSYRSSITGLNPVEEKHGSHIDVEPITGMSIDLLVRFQINLDIQRLPGFYAVSDVEEGVYPVFWAELSLEIDDDLASFMKRNVRLPKTIAYSVIGALFFLGAIGSTVSGAIWGSFKRGEGLEPLIAEKKSSLQKKHSSMHSETGSVEKVKCINSNEPNFVASLEKSSEALQAKLSDSFVVSVEPSA